jgi:anti-sigma factor RsiW
MDIMYCNELVENVTEYMEDALDPRDRTRFDAHSSVCPGCQAHLGEFTVTLSLLSSLSEEPLTDEMESDLVAVYRRWAGSVSS